MASNPKVEQFGNSTWPRYRIVLGQCVWSGRGWSETPSDALVFAQVKEAMSEWKTVVNQMNGGMSEYRLTTTVTVTIRSHGYVLAELREYLAANAHIHVDREPPVLPDVAIMDMQIAWSKLSDQGPDVRSGDES